jgi:hypothetical protein
LYVQIMLDREYAVMTDEDEDGETAQYRRPDETLAGIACSLHKDHSHIAHEWTSDTRRRGPNTKADEGTTPNSTHCGCGAVALPAVGFDLHDLWRLRTLHEIQPGFSKCAYSMAGTSIWIGIAVHRNIVHRFWRRGGSSRVGKTRPISFLSRAANFAISTGQSRAWIWVEMERQAPT